MPNNITPENFDKQLRFLVKMMKSEDDFLINLFEQTKDKRILETCLDSILRANGTMKTIMQSRAVVRNPIIEETVDYIKSSYNRIRNKAISNGMDVSKYPIELGYLDPKEN